MLQLLNVWSALDLRRRLIVIAATVAVFLAVLGVARMAGAPSYSLLYAGLEPGAAGEVVRALESRGATYEVRGGALYVETAQRDELRMTLASEGLPANSAQGYELLDSLSGFGTTSQMFDAAYWRAKEGELARTIVASPKIVQARVHIATTGAVPFRRAVKPTASISVTAQGGPIDPAQASAWRHLVAAAVSGLDPDDVAVVDSSGRLIAGDAEAAAGPIADDRADRIRDRVRHLVEARVGRGNAVVEVSVETVTQSEVIRERRFDPEGRVAVSTDTEERNSQDQDGGTNAVTVASNLPDGEANSSESSNSQNSETRERVNYEVSETTREISREPGDIKRISVAVLVNSLTEAGTADALSEDDIDALSDLVRSAVGFEEARGDVITIRAMAFQPIEPDGTVSEAGFGMLDRFDWQMLAQMGLLGFVALAIGLFVVRPVLTAEAQRPEPLPLPTPRDPAEAPGAAESVLTGEIADDFTLGDLPMAAATGDSMMTVLEPEDATVDPVERLKALIDERRDETVEILRSWLDDKEETR